MKFDDLCKRLDETNIQEEAVGVTEHTEKVLQALIERGLISENSCESVDE